MQYFTALEKDESITKFGFTCLALVEVKCDLRNFKLWHTRQANVHILYSTAVIMNDNILYYIFSDCS